MNIIINANDLDDDSKQNITNALMNLVGQLSQDLSIDTLQGIIVPDDFGDEIHSFQEEHGLEKGYTENELAVVTGKTLEYQEDDALKQMIFLDKRSIYALFGNDEELKNQAVNWVHHELCHVHDNQILEQVTGYVEVNHFDTILEYHLFRHAHVCWEEYVACRLSSRTLFRGHDANIPLFLDLIEKTKLAATSLIGEYRFHGDIELLYRKIQEESILLLKTGCQVKGFMHGLGLGSVNENLGECLEDTYFSSSSTVDPRF